MSYFRSHQLRRCKTIWTEWQRAVASSADKHDTTMPINCVNLMFENSPIFIFLVQGLVIFLCYTWMWYWLCNSKELFQISKWKRRISNYNTFSADFKITQLQIIVFRFKIRKWSINIYKRWIKFKFRSTEIYK